MFSGDLQEDLHIFLLGFSLLDGFSGVMDYRIWLNLESTYEWMHTMLLFLGLGYLNQDCVSSFIHLHANSKMPMSFTPR